MKSSGVSMALEALDGADIATTDSATCAEFLRHAKRVRGWVDSVEAQVTSRMRTLHANEAGAPASDLHARCGGVSSAEGKRKERRSETIDEAPSFGDALATGSIGAEHVDALANATTKLDDDTKAALFDLEDDLLSDAVSMSPEKFGRSCRERARRLERDQGIERNRRQRRETFLSHKLNMAGGMVEGRFAFHPELGWRLQLDADRTLTITRSDGQFHARCHPDIPEGRKRRQPAA